MVINTVNIFKMAFQSGSVTTGIFIFKILMKSRCQRHKVGAGPCSSVFTGSGNMVKDRSLIIIHIADRGLVLVQRLRQLQHIIGSAALCRILCQKTGNRSGLMEHLPFTGAADRVDMSAGHCFPEKTGDIPVIRLSSCLKYLHAAYHLGNVLVRMESIQRVNVLCHGVKQPVVVKQLRSLQMLRLFRVCI